MKLSFLWRWLRRSRRLRPDLALVLFTRSGCPLCDEAEQVLRAYQESHGFSLESKNVDDAADLQQQFGACVPVVTINGKVRFRGHVNEVLLRRILDS